MLICTGCNSTDTIDEIRARHPDAISCCPERHMVDVDIWRLMQRIDRLEAAVRELNPGLSW